MDSILTVGPIDEKLKLFIKRMGFQVFSEQSENGIIGCLGKEVIDLILIDSAQDKIAHEFCQFFRKTEATRDTPIIALVPDKLSVLQIKELHIEKVDAIQAPYSIGTVASRMMTQVRLRKMSGTSDWTTSLSEMNAGLRDLNKRFQKELEEARAIQQALLPKNLPQGENYSISAYYKPLEEVGGDWYFVRTEPSGGLSLLIADVTGHGLAAAFIGSMTKLALGASGQELPGKRLEAMNRLMAPHLPEGRFITANAYLYEPKTGKLHFGRAGGPQALLCRAATQEVIELRGDGFPLGFFEEGDYSDDSIDMAPGDTLTVVTDGVVEAINREKKMYGIEGTVASIKNCPNPANADVLIKHVVKAFDTFIDGKLLKDDVTVLVLKRES